MMRGRPRLAAEPSESTTLRLDPALRRELDALAVKRRTTLAALLREGARMVLSHD